MSKIRGKSEEIRKFILDHVEQNPADIAKLASTQFDISRQAINKHLQKLIDEKLLIEAGQTRSRIYKLAPIFEYTKSYKISPDLAEDVVWRNDIQPIFNNTPDNVLDIWRYGFTEMFNNAIDHSGGTEIVVHIKRNAVITQMLIHDNGIGIFKKIQTALNLLDERHAIFELAKGKLTTDPKHHSGEGIFFSSRAFDSYKILSGGVFFSHDFGKSEDWLIENTQFEIGTTVLMKLNNHTARTLKKIFDQYTSATEYGFNKTIVPVKLAQYGNDKLVSRSQAKRLLARIELFKVVILDFADVDSIGQAFADEIFRVFASLHPEINLTAINTNHDVKQMIQRAQINLPTSK